MAMKRQSPRRGRETRQPSRKSAGRSASRRRMPPPAGRSPEISSAEQRRLFELWRQLSMLVHRTRHSPYPASSNQALRGVLEAEPEGLLAPALVHWMGDSLVMEARFREAIDTYRTVIERYPDRSFGGRPWAAYALEGMALCHQRLGDLDAAAADYAHLQRSFPGETSPAWIYYQIGQLAEEAGNDAEAIRAYARAAEAPDEPAHGQVAIPDLARRDAARLRSGREWVRPHPESLARLLARALERRDSEALEALASPTHFSFGLAGSERRFIERGGVLADFRADLARSEVHADPAALRGAGGKLYLETHGWQGELFTGRVLLILTRNRDGYEWSGVALTEPARKPSLWIPKAPPDREPPEEPPAPGGEPSGSAVTPASLNMKSPWPRGLDFRAGGLIGFFAQLAAFEAIAASLAPFGPAMYAALLETASLTSGCGFGPGGLYYGQPTTHVGRDTFAVDFSRFIQGLPLWLDAYGKPALAVADGVVWYVFSSSATGSPVWANEVDIGHMTAEEILMAFIIELLTGKRTLPKYTSEYLHLDGPNLIPVSVGMFVRQGARLGIIDDTGLSVSHHLHFSLHDRDLPVGADSVRPTPLDGQTLNDWDDGRCLFSTNIPIP